jgi:hypothetical protein
MDLRVIVFPCLNPDIWEAACNDMGAVWFFNNRLHMAVHVDGTEYSLA